MVGHVYATLPQEPDTTGTLIKGTFVINGILAHVLFNSRASHTFIAHDLASALGITKVVLRRPLEIIFLVTHGAILHQTYMQVRVSLEDCEFEVDLVILSTRDFDVILGMDSQSACMVWIDCFSKTVTFESSDIIGLL